MQGTSMTSAYSEGRGISVDKQRQSRNQQQNCRDQEAAEPPSYSQQQDEPMIFTVNICSAKLHKFTPIEGCAKGLVIAACLAYAMQRAPGASVSKSEGHFVHRDPLLVLDYTHTALLPSSIEPESNAFSQQHVEGTIETANTVCFLDAGKASVKWNYIKKQISNKKAVQFKKISLKSGKREADFYSKV